MAFQGKDPERKKIILENKPIEQISHFNYLGCDTSYEYDNCIKNKLHKFQYICGTIRSMLKNTRKDTRIKIFKAMAISTLLYGSETWILKKRDEAAIQSSEMKFQRSVKGKFCKGHY